MGLDKRKSSFGVLHVQVGIMIGTVCDDGFGTKEGVAICRYLGYPYIREYSANQNVGFPYRGEVLMDQFHCAKNQTDYRDCQFFKKHSTCHHKEDIWIKCEEKNYNGTYPIKRTTIY